MAAKRRAARRLRILGWTAAAVAVALALTGTLVLLHRGGQAAAGGSPELGPEGMPLQTGVPLAPAGAAASGAAVDGVRCDAAEQVAYHIHAHLAVFVDGTSRPVPYGIGVVTPLVTDTPQGPFAQATRCYYWLHTHAADGVIHVESPSERQYTLGNFFDIWRQPLGRTRVGQATGPVTAYVDGKAYPGDPRGIVLREHADIQLDVGSPVVPPQPVDWSRSQL
jgi:hypothetical protein